MTIKTKITMKHLILILGILVSLAATRIVFAQQEGTIDYETKVNVHRSLPPDRAEMKEMIPEFNTYQSSLLFSATESLYVNADEEDEEFGDDDGAVQVKMKRPMNEYYFDYPRAKSVARMEFLGKYFLIEDSVKRIPWKLHHETKNILGFVCKKATWFNPERKQNIVAWYTDKLPPSLGPETFNNLPGTILEIDINEGERMICAKKISPEPLPKGRLKAPVKGEKATEASFRQMIEEQRKRMGGGNIIIRH
jgi:GLPGLI family protein